MVAWQHGSMAGWQVGKVARKGTGPRRGRAGTEKSTENERGERDRERRGKRGKEKKRDASTSRRRWDCHTCGTQLWGGGPLRATRSRWGPPSRLLLYPAPPFYRTEHGHAPSLPTLPLPLVLSPFPTKSKTGQPNTCCSFFPSISSSSASSPLLQPPRLPLF